MKKNLLSIVVISLISLVVTVNTTHAQKTVTANVPADGAFVRAAIDAVEDQLEPGDSLVITVDPGTYIFDGRNDLGWGGNLFINILIKGAGADQTEFKFDLTERPGPDNPGVSQFHSIFSEENDSSTVKIEGIKFMYGGNFNNKGNAIGAVVRLFKPESLAITFENCIFDSNTGIMLFNGFRKDISYSFNNCQFTNNLTLGVGNKGRTGIIENSGYKYLSVTNCTFMSNEVIDYAAYRETSASALNISVKDSAYTYDIILENNAFINAMVNLAEFDTVLSVVKVDVGEYSNVNFTMNNNIFMGNFSEATGTPTDILLINPENIEFTSEGNILNKVLELTDEGVYENYSIPGSMIDETYTYTDPRISFEMNFDLPNLVPDEYGIGHVNYTGDGSDPNSVNIIQPDKFKAYVNNNLLRVEGLKSGGMVEVYNILGAKIISRRANSNNLEMTLPNGIFIVKSGQYSKKVFSH